MTSYTSLFVTISTESGNVINGGSKRGPCERPNFKQVPQFLKSNRISPDYGLTSNKDQTSINKSCFVFLLYRGMCRFCAIFGRFGCMTAFGPLEFAFEGNGSPPPVNTYMCTPTKFKGDICTDYFPRVHANSPLHRQIISQI